MRRYGADTGQRGSYLRLTRCSSSAQLVSRDARDSQMVRASRGRDPCRARRPSLGCDRGSMGSQDATACSLWRKTARQARFFLPWRVHDDETMLLEEVTM